jgi:hypothetical protein
MKASELASLRKTITEGFPNNPFTDTLFDVWVERLMPYEHDKIIAVLRDFIAADKWRPSLDEVTAALYEGPSAAELARQAYRAVGQFGYHSEERARNELPTPVWDVIEAFGGWWQLCTSNDDGSLRERLAKCADRTIRNPPPPKRLSIGTGTDGAVIHVLRGVVKNMDEL